MTEQFSQPVPPEKDDEQRDKYIRHAQYLLDNGYIKGISLDVLIKQLESHKTFAMETPKVAPNLPQAGRIETFGDLEDFM